MKKHFIKSIGMLIITLLSVPLIVWGLASYYIKDLDNSYSEDFIQYYTSKSYDREKVNQFFTRHPASSVCGTANPDLMAYSEAVCERGSELWQLITMQKGVWITLIVGFTLPVIMGMLSGLAFFGRRAQLWSVRIALPLTKAMGVLLTLAQGAIATWMAYWITFVSAGRHDMRIFAAIVIMVGFGIVVMVVSIFAKGRAEKSTNGEVILREQAPELWARVEGLSQQVGTPPPDNIVVGINDNFYVTEAPVYLRQQVLTGRTLFVSIPLLRQLSMAQADGIMVHELTHLHQGDAKASAALSVMLTRLNRYMEELRVSYLAWGVYLTLKMYRILFALACSKEGRQGEYIADRSAADLIGAQSVAESLIKVTAYSAYRAEVERSLFEHNALHDELGINSMITAGLHDYAHSPKFVEIINNQNIPHPFDSHPILCERMKNVGYSVSDEHLSAIVTAQPSQSWADLIPSAESIENEMWQRYENQFQSSHEEILAWRYLPENEQEKALVLKYFPACSYALTRGRQLVINYEGIEDKMHEELIPWSNMKKVIFRQRYGAYTLILKLHTATPQGNKKVKIRLAGLKNNTAGFKNTFQHYWNRYQYAQAYQQQQMT